MAKKLYTESYIEDIIAAIRAKNGSTDPYTIDQLAAAITAIPTGSSITVESLSVTSNGTYTAPSGKAYSPVTVNVPTTTVNALSVTENGTYTPASGTAYGPVTVNVSGGSAAFPATACLGNSKFTTLPSDFVFAPRTSGAQLFRLCSSLTSAPPSSQLDTSTLTNVNEMFAYCSAMTTVPEYDLSGISGSYANTKNMYSNCGSLSNQALQNILKSFLTITSAYTGTKTLQMFGLTSAQATTCTGFTEWATLTSRGWTTGY